MKTSFINPLLLPVGVFIALMSTTAVSEDLAEALDPTRICTISSKGKVLTIVAGPDLNTPETTNFAAEFPINRPCPPESELTGLCSQWNYRYLWGKIKPSLAYVDMSSDLTLVSIDNSGNFSKAGAGEPQSGSGENNYDARWIKWSEHGTNFDASFITSLAEPRIASAGGKSGNFEGFCAILGAGVPIKNNGYAQDTLVAEKIIRTSDGDEMCTIVDPVTQCETGVYCGTLDVLPNIAIASLINANNLAVIEVSVPGQACPTFVTNDGLPDTRYYCSGGRCYYFN